MPAHRLLRPRNRLVSGLLCLAMNLMPAVAAEQLIYVGTYTQSTSQGIYAVRLDSRTGTLSAPELVGATSNPSFLALAPDGHHLYAVNEVEGRARPLVVDAATGGLTPLAERASGGQGACHLVVDRTGRTLLVAHYKSGVLAALPITSDGTLGLPSSVIAHEGEVSHPSRRQDGPHVHSVTLSPDNRFVIVCDLGLDKIFIYALDPATAQLTPAAIPFITTAPGAGPRHGAFSPDGQRAFVINELNGTLSSFAYEAATGALTLLDTQSTLPADFQGANTCAEVRVHPNGRFVYGSNRGHDSIAVFALDQATGRLATVEWISSGGHGPRNFALSPDGAWLVVANQKSDSLKVFRVDATTGRLTAVEGGATVPMPVCVLFANHPTS